MRWSWRYGATSSNSASPLVPGSTGSASAAQRVFSVGISLVGLATATLIRLGTGLDAVRLYARRGPEWLAPEWVSQKDLIGD